MVPNAAIRNLIREDKVHQIYSLMQIGQGKRGMQTMNQSLYLAARRSAWSRWRRRWATRPIERSCACMFDNARRPAAAG